MDLWFITRNLYFCTYLLKVSNTTKCFYLCCQIILYPTSWHDFSKFNSVYLYAEYFWTVSSLLFSLFLLEIIITFNKCTFYTIYLIKASKTNENTWLRLIIVYLTSGVGRLSAFLRRSGNVAVITLSRSTCTWCTSHMLSTTCFLPHIH